LNFSIFNLFPLVYLCGALFIGYLSLLLVFLISWSKIPTRKKVNKNALYRISIVVAVRNEADNILLLLNGLMEQDYPLERYEIIIIDDRSTDDTYSIVSSFKTNCKILKLLRNDLDDSLSPKKKALEMGISHSNGEIIVTTDGDCRVAKNWLNSINRHFQDGVHCVCGPVTYINRPSIFGQLQIIEFAALLGAGAATINMKGPGMCNGANFSYRKAAYQAVEGFKDIDSVASGDDELLMHKILKRFPGSVVFMKDENAIVETESNLSWRLFYNQRKRWASKWSYYKSPIVKALAIFIFLFNLYMVSSAVLVAFGVINWKVFLIQYIVKLLFEALFIFRILKFLKKKIHLIHFLVLQILYPLYTTFFGIVANFGGYEWKDRKVNK
jgi:cellulose synthase/poly-beta-1,6-N-acetylglucosamine synthase-like glycosyltransferase